MLLYCLTNEKENTNIIALVLSNECVLVVTEKIAIFCRCCCNYTFNFACFVCLLYFSQLIYSREQASEL